MNNLELFTTFDGLVSKKDEMLLFLKSEFSRIGGEVMEDEPNKNGVPSFEIYFSEEISKAMRKRDVVESICLWSYYQDKITNWLKLSNDIEMVYNNNFLNLW